MRNLRTSRLGNSSTDIHEEFLQKDTTRSKEEEKSSSKFKCENLSTTNRLKRKFLSKEYTCTTREYNEKKLFKKVSKRNNQQTSKQTKSKRSPGISSKANHHHCQEFLWQEMIRRA